MAEAWRTLHLRKICAHQGWEPAHFLRYTPPFSGPTPCPTPWKSTVPTLEHDGLERRYQLTVPDGIDGPTPLVIVLHGGGGNGKHIADITGFPDLAERAGFIAAFPSAHMRHWYDDRNIRLTARHPEFVDDTGFLTTLIDTIAAGHPVDPARVYIAGASNGAMMAYRMAREAGHRIAAIGAVMGLLPEHYRSHGDPEVSMPVCLIHGTDDPIVPFTGGEMRVQRKFYGNALSADDTIAYWAAHNHCITPPEIEEMPETDDENSMLVRRESYTYGTNGAEAVLYVVKNGGHTWPGGKQYAGEWLIGRTCSNFDATAALWEFFQRHRRD